MNYKERNREIKYLRFSKGYTLNLIGMMYNVSGECICQICKSKKNIMIKR